MLCLAPVAVSVMSAASAQSDTRLYLPQVTLCAVTSVNVPATLKALEYSLARVRFGACKLLTDMAIEATHPEIEIVPIDPIRSSAAYSDFMLGPVSHHVETSHCLVTQWDGHLLDATRWRESFLDYDYIGASWPQFGDSHDVGNGGFSLRSRRLMDACRDPAFVPVHPEDLAIGRQNRAWLEDKGMLFAPRELADLFSAERRSDSRETFGYHGVWNMPRALGTETFWHIYRELDERGTIWGDFSSLWRDIVRGPRGMARSVVFLRDRLLRRWLRHRWAGHR